MNAGGATVVFLAGTIVLISTGCGVLLTAIAPGGRPSRLVFAMVSLLIRVSRRVGRHAPGQRARRVLGRMVGPMALLLPALVWGAGTVTGIALLAAAVGAAPPDIRALAYVLGQLDDSRSYGHGFTIAALAGLAFISAVLVARTAAVAFAYQRRERFIWVLSNEVRSCLDAEEVIVARMRDGTTDSLDRMLNKWQLWMADLRFSHTSYPELLALPSPLDLSWPDAALVVLDVAALIDALSPESEPPPTRPLLTTGCVFVQEMARELQLKVVQTTPSLHGREERSFLTTLARLADAGVCPASDYPAARTAFQQWRSRYAPYTSALSDLLALSDLPSEEMREPADDLIPETCLGSQVNTLQIPADKVSPSFSPVLL